MSDENIRRFSSTHAQVDSRYTTAFGGGFLKGLMTAALLLLAWSARGLVSGRSRRQ